MINWRKRSTQRRQWPVAVDGERQATAAILDEIETSVLNSSITAAGPTDSRTGHPDLGCGARLHPWERGWWGHIIPWNYPLDIFARGLLQPGRGNTVVVNRRGNPAILLALGRLTAEVGFPPGVVNVVSGYGQEAGAALAGHSGIQALAFCGSIEAGKEVLRLAAQNITPVLSLELGGKSPLIIFADSDM